VNILRPLLTVWALGSSDVYYALVTVFYTYLCEPTVLHLCPGPGPSH